MTFKHAVRVILEREGWGEYTNDPADAGGPTRWGITLRTLAAHRRRPVTADDVRALGMDEAEAIYRALYWQPCRCDELAPGVALVTFDAAVQHGTGDAVRFIQRAAGVVADGSFGPKTLAAVKASAPLALVDKIMAARLFYYTTLTGWPRFGRGWINRIIAVNRTALTWEFLGHADDIR